MPSAEFTDIPREPSDLLKRVEILNVREGGLIEAMVPVELIDRAEVPVDQEHVEELAASMLTELEKGTISGQISPIVLAEVPGRAAFPIVDGFHRDAAIALLGQKKIFATIRPNTTEDELLDLRILTANTHKSVSFSRIYEWVSGAWATTPWVGRIEPSQAFGLVAAKSATGQKLGLTPEETAEIQAWARDKSEKWRLGAAAIQNVMTTAQVSAPDLVSKVRKRTGGGDLETITQQHLSVIAKTYPNEFEVQRRLSEVAVSQNLTIAETKQVVEFLQGIDINEVISTIEITDWRSMFNKGPTRRYTRKQRPTPETPSDDTTMTFESRGIQTQFLLAELHIARLSLENTVLLGNYTASPLHDSRQPAFTIQYDGHSRFEDALVPLSGPQASDDMITRLEELHPKLMGALGRSGLSDEDAERAIRSIGQRLSQDIEAGILRHVAFKKAMPFDELILAALKSEVQLFKAGRIAPIIPIHNEPSVYHLETSLKLTPDLKHTARTTLALVGFMGASAHGVGQVLNVDPIRTGQMISVVHQRLASTERNLPAHYDAQEA